MRKQLLFVTILAIWSYSSQAMAVNFYFIEPKYWKVEKTDGCGKKPLHWFSTTTTFNKYYTSGNRIYYHHDGTLTDHNIDGFRIWVESNLCPNGGDNGDDWTNNWYYRRKVNGSWTWDSNCDYEGFKGWVWGDYVKYVCRYRIEQRSRICNRDYVSSSGGHPRVARMYLHGYEFEEGFYASNWVYFHTDG